MHSLQRLKVFIVLVGLMCAQLAIGKPAAPNILMIVADDLGYGDSSAWFEASDKHTPTLNQLAQNGSKFTRFYTDSTCSTTRASLLTGQHPARLGFHPVARGIPVELTTLPEYLQQAQYKTALIGKWHIGELYPQSLPNAQGFDYFFGYLNQWFLQGPAEDGSLQLKGPVYYNPWLTENQQPMAKFDGYLPEILTAKAEQWLSEQAADKPWFLLYATPLPHGPLVAPPELAASDDKQAIYHAMVSRFDADLARIIAALEKSGQRDNTLIVILSDNGAPEKLTGSNAGFAGGKWSYSEGAVRVPMLWLWPKNFAPVAQPASDEVVFVADIFPSLQSYLSAWVPKRALPQQRDGRDIFTEPEPAALNWMSRNSYSRLEGDQRFSGNWIYRTWIERQWEQIAGTGSERKIIDEKKAREAEQKFRAWLLDVSQTRLIKSKHGEYRGNDFLRTPLKEWDFYLAFIAKAHESDKPQWLAGQPGSWQLTWTGKTLDLAMHGGSWQLRLRPDEKCHVIGINADLYDRFTNVGGTTNLSRVTVTIDAIERLDAKWQVEDLTQLDITQPLFVAASQQAEYASWQGQAGEPLMFHRANRAGEWAFWLDEKQIHQQLCERLSGNNAQ